MRTSAPPRRLSSSHFVNGAELLPLMQQAGLFELHGLIAGVDEAGRGPLAGPVVAAAVILSPERPIDGLADSKKLSPARRERLADRIRRDSMAWSVGWSDPAEIDDVNILAANTDRD
mgnify:FL=1